LIASTLLSSFTGKLIIAYIAIVALLLASLLIASYSASYDKYSQSLNADYALHFARKTVALYRSEYAFPAPSNVIRVSIRTLLKYVPHKKKSLVWVERTEWWIMFSALVLCVMSWDIGYTMIVLPIKRATNKYYPKLCTWLRHSPASLSTSPDPTVFSTTLLHTEHLKDVVEPEERMLNRDIQLTNIIDILLRIETKLHEFDSRIETLERLNEERHLNLDTKVTSLESISRVQYGTLANVNQMQSDTVTAVKRVEENIVKRMSKVEDTQIEGMKKLEDKQMEIEKKIEETLPKMMEKEVEVEKRLDIVEHVVVRRDNDNESLDWFGQVM
jgi:hypothetical protein